MAKSKKVKLVNKGERLVAELTAATGADATKSLLRYVRKIEKELVQCGGKVTQVAALVPAPALAS